MSTSEFSIIDQGDGVAFIFHGGIMIGTIAQDGAPRFSPVLADNGEWIIAEGRSYTVCGHAVDTPGGELEATVFTSSIGASGVRRVTGSGTPTTYPGLKEAAKAMREAS